MLSHDDLVVYVHIADSYLMVDKSVNFINWNVQFLQNFMQCNIHILIPTICDFISTY